MRKPSARCDRSPLLSFTARRGAVLLAACALLALASRADAQTSGTSFAFGAAVDTTLAPPVGSDLSIGLDPTPSAGGTAPGPYDDGPNDVASLLVSSGLTGQILSTGAVETSASSTIPDALGATADAIVDGLDVRIVNALLAKLLTITAQTVESTAAIGGACGALVATGGATFENGQVGGTLGAGTSIAENPPANQVLIDELGVRVIVNEQVSSGDGVTQRGLVVNALHLELDVSLLGIGVLSGDIFIGHAEAAVQCGTAPTATPTPTPQPTASGSAATPTPQPSGGPTAAPTAAPTPGPTPTAPPGVSGDDPYTDDLGLDDAGFAGATLNPNGIGQLLYGMLYDVRPVAGIGGADAQITNLRITNLNPIGAENGGVLLRVRFRESRASREVHALDVALSCGEEFAAAVFLGGGGDAALPQIRSILPIVTTVSPTQVTTGPALDPDAGGQPGTFALPAGAVPDDVRRGYIEVIAEEQLPCEPLEPGGFSRSGNVFARLGGELATPPNSLAGQVFLVRPSAGSSFAYDMAAIARFVIAGGGSIQAPIESGLPDVRSCVGWDRGSESTFTGLAPCLAQIDLALAKARVQPGYDVTPITAGKTYVVVTLPTKGTHCSQAGVAKPPFRCTASGERIGCRVFDREENEVLPSPTCALPRELSFLAIGGAEGDPRADARIDVGDFITGWTLFDYVADPEPGGTGAHARSGLDPDRVGFIGVPADGFRGLPALTLVIQEYTNGNVGGAFGLAIAPPGALEILGLRR